MIRLPEILVKMSRIIVAIISRKKTIVKGPYTAFATLNHTKVSEKKIIEMIIEAYCFICVGLPIKKYYAAKLIYLERKQKGVEFF